MKLYLNIEKTHLNDALTMVFCEGLKDHCAMLKKSKDSLAETISPTLYIVLH